MQGKIRTIARPFFRLLLGALLIAAIVPPAAGAAPKQPQRIKSGWSSYFPERVHGDSVAIAPDGVPWFGLMTQAEGPSLAHRQAGQLEIEPLQKQEAGGTTTALNFDSQGALWFAVQDEGAEVIARRDPNGTVTKFNLPKGGTVNAMTFGPEGALWFVRGDYGETSQGQVGRMTMAGAVTQFPLEAGVHPTSITVGPDGALWFNEELAGKIGRITTSGEVQLYALATRVQPRQIVSGFDGTLWFGENARARLYGKTSDRIGRITTDGQVSELPVPFGTGTSRLVADPRGVIWFATDEGEFSSISPSGNVGARGCARSCRDPIEDFVLAPGGGLLFAAGHATCLMCGGGSDLMIENEGTRVGEIPAGALTPADPDGPPAEDPFANGQPKPPPPIARTGKPWAVEGISAEVTGFVNPRGAPASWRFRWGSTKRYGHHGFAPEWPFEAGDGAARVEEPILDLCPGRTYHYEIVAYGPGGRSFGGDRTFRTPREEPFPKGCGVKPGWHHPPPAPKASTGAAQDLEPTQAVITGTVDPAANLVAAYRFEWGRSTAYGHVTEVSGDTKVGGDYSHRVEATIDGLLPDTTYHYRLRAHSEGGTTRGHDRQFTTPR